jgi:hypothetical protein
MNRHDNRIISGIVSFIGIDYNLLKKSGEDNIAKFYLSGFLVLVIFALSFFSVFYAFDLMFHRWYAEFLLATFFSLTFLTIYLLLIQTFSKETLPASYKVTFFSTSNITRICFVFMISFLMAQPLKIFLLSDELDSDITNYKNDLYNNFLTRTNQLYQKDLRKLNQEKLRYIQLSDAAAIDKLDERMADIHTVMQTDQEEAQGEIDHSDFFLKRIAFCREIPAVMVHLPDGDVHFWLTRLFDLFPSPITVNIIPKKGTMITNWSGGNIRNLNCIIAASFKHVIV